YWISLGPGSGTNGAIYEISYSTGNHAPNAVAAATPTDGLAPLNVSFTGQGSSDVDNDTLTYKWDFGDGQSATGRDVSHTYNANGKYTATLTVTDGKGGSGNATVAITVGNRHPTPTITLPLTGAHYSAGNTISYAGSATDPEDGTLPASAFNW